MAQVWGAERQAGAALAPVSSFIIRHRTGPGGGPVAFKRPRNVTAAWRGSRPPSGALNRTPHAGGAQRGGGYGEEGGSLLSTPAIRPGPALRETFP